MGAEQPVLPGGGKMGARLWRCCVGSGRGEVGHGGPSRHHPRAALSLPPPAAGEQRLLGRRGPSLAGLCGEDRVFSTAVGASRPCPRVSSAGSGLAEPSSFPWASVLPVHWAPLAERCPCPPGSSVPDSLPCSSCLALSWAMGTKQLPRRSSCSQGGAVEPPPSPAASPVPPTLWQGPGPGAVPAFPGGLWGGQVGSCRACAPWHRKRWRKAEVPCCGAGGLGGILG